MPGDVWKYMIEQQLLYSQTLKRPRSLFRMAPSHYPLAKTLPPVLVYWMDADRAKIYEGKQICNPGAVI